MSHHYSYAMSNREIAIDLIQKLPENASLYEVAREIEFIAGVREGFEQLERGEGVPAETVREMVHSLPQSKTLRVFGGVGGRGSGLEGENP